MNNVNHITVLITSMGSTTAISVAKALTLQKEYDVTIIGMDINRKDMIAGSQFCHHFHTVSPVYHEFGYIENIRRIIETHHVDLVIPIIEPELEVLARNRKQIERETFLLLSSLETIQLCNDKLAMFQFLKEHNIPTLATFTPDEENLEHISFPVIAKPRYGWGSHDVHEVRCVEDFPILSRIQDPILQIMGRGDEYTIDVFSDGNQVIAAIPRCRIETRSGISYKGQTIHHPHLEEYANKITEALHIFGPANIQCFIDANDIWILEINPRFSAGLTLSTAAGINLPLLAVKMVKGELLSPQESFRNIRMCRYWDEVFFDGI